jgi:hypothetical protein
MTSSHFLTFSIRPPLSPLHHKYNKTMPAKPKSALICSIALCGTISLFGIASSPMMHNSRSANLSSSSTPQPLSDITSASSQSNTRRRLSVALPNGGCQITWPQPPPGAFLIAHVVCRVHCLLLVYFLVILTYLSLSQHTNNLCSIVSRLWSSHDMESRRGFDGSSNRRRLEQQWSW